MRTRLAILLLLLTWGGPASLAAEEPAGERRLLSDDFSVSLGGFVVDFDTSAQVGRDVLSGSIQMEDDLALDADATTFRLDGFYRFNPRHSIDFGYFSLSRAGLTVLDRQVRWGGVLYDVGARVESEVDIDFVRATWRYSFVNNGRTEAGIVAGLSTYRFGAGLDGEATVDDGSGGTTVQRVRRAEEVLAPIPVFGLFIAQTLGPRWVLRINAELFDLETGDYEGRVVDTRISVDYYFSRHVGIGIGKSTTDIAFSADTGEDGFSVDYKQDGLLAYLSLAY